MINISFSPPERQLLASRGVRAIILFGSHATGTANSASDVDVAILSSAALSQDKNTYDFLYDLLSSKIPGPINIDIVFANSAGLELKNHVSKYGRPLYQSSPHEFSRFKEQAMIELSDLAPIRKLFADATLARISP